jgi:3-oxoacyl-[acyl-carrier protein] reductase
MNIDLKGRLAVVTGAGGQLGRAMVRTLAECGADVAIHVHNNPGKAPELEGALKRMGRRTGIFKADVGDAGSVMAMRDAINASLGKPDIIITNAVAQYKWTTVLEQAPADYESQFRTCVLQNVLMAQAFVPAMIEKKWGRVIGINTECVMQLQPSQSAYVSGKRGMDGVMKILAREVGPHQVTVNQVAPGWTISDRDREKGTERSPDYEKNVALRRRGTDADIANAVAFLASDLAGFITGAFIPVCGGYIMPSI